MKKYGGGQILPESAKKTAAWTAKDEEALREEMGDLDEPAQDQVPPEGEVPEATRG